MKVSAAQVKELRSKTGAGIMDCKRALLETGGNVQKAIEYLRRRGMAKAQRRLDQATSQGKVCSYVHTGGKIGVLLEVNCETDFVANTAEFNDLVKDLAMQVAAANPAYLRAEDVPEEVLERHRQQWLVEARESAVPKKAVEDRVSEYLSEVCLLEQPFIRDQGIKIKELVAQMAAKFGENIAIRRFIRYRLGEDLEKPGEET